MQLAYHPYILIPLVALAVALVLAVRVWRYRTRPIAKVFLVLMLALAEWSLAAFMEHASVGLADKVFWVKMAYPGVVTIPLAWLVFTLQYTGREKWLTRRNVAALIPLPVITLVMVWTNNLHHLVWKDIWLDASLRLPVVAVTHNTWFWVHVAYAYVMLLLSTLCLFSVFLHSSGVYRKQAGTLLLAALVPWVGNLLFVAGIGPFASVDPTPLAFAVTGSAFFWGLSRFQLLDILPIAREAIFTSMSDGVIVLDTEHRIVDINVAAQHVLGRTSADVVGQLGSRVLPGQAASLELQADVANTETEIVFGEGEGRRCYVVRVSPIYTKERLNGHLVLLHDDTERKRAQIEAGEKLRLETELVERKRAEEEIQNQRNYFQALFRNAPEGIVSLDLQHHVVDLNPAFEKMFGYSLDELQGRDTIDYIVPQARNEEARGIRRRTVQGGVSFAPDTIRKRADGSEFPASVLSAPVTIEGRQVGNFALFRDITESKRAEEEIKRLYEQVKAFNVELEKRIEERTRELEIAVKDAEAANRAKSEFLSSMSHELRTPLTAVIGFSQVLAEQYFGELNEKQAEYVKDILDSGEHLLSLINDVLDLAKVEAGKAELEPTEVDMKELLKSSLVMIKEKTATHSIGLEARISPTLDDLLILADQRKLKQVMFNLLSNAAKFTPDHGRITVEAGLEGGEITVSVADTGIGIDPVDQGKVFDEFYQVHSGPKDKTPGTGLGLPLSRHFVEMHGGRIWVESEGKDRGSRFIFSLPVQEANRARETAP